MNINKLRETDGPMIRLGAAAALVLASACAAPILATQGEAGMVTGKVTGKVSGTAPVSCGVATETRGGMTTFRPWVQTAAGGSGSYHFALSGAGSVVNQEGGFDAAPARHEMLGEAVMQGPATDYDVALTVDVGGVSYSCRVDAADI